MLNEEFDWRRDKLDKVDPVSGPAEEIKVSEVKEAIAKSKSGKAFGPSGVVRNGVRNAESSRGVGGGEVDEHLQRCHQGREDSRRLEERAGW